MGSNIPIWRQQRDNQILIILNNKKQWNCHLVDFAIPAYHTMKIKWDAKSNFSILPGSWIEKNKKNKNKKKQKKQTN